MREFAPAKINLALHVVGRRADGYHRLESLVVFASDCGDTLTASDATETGIGFAGPFGDALRGLPVADNLVLRAARFADPDRPLRWTLTKHIPVAAGLGGGSADAAAAIRLLFRDSGRELSIAATASLGADIPMCLLSRPLVAEGIGEELRPVKGMPTLPLVLACPPVAIRTGDVFRALADPNQAPLPWPPKFEGPEAVAAWLRATRNDLSAPAAAVSPGAGAAAAAIAADRECLFARMSGSGPSAYGLFATPEAAERAAARLAAAQPTWWVCPAITGGS